MNVGINKLIQNNNVIACSQHPKLICHMLHKLLIHLFFGALEQNVIQID